MLFFINLTRYISKWNTLKVNNMSGMFGWCYSLSNLPDISKWNISNVNDFSYMFYECISLSKLPSISKWNIQSGSKIKIMFDKCYSLSYLPNITKWKSSFYLFSDCISLLNISKIANFK